MQFFSKKSLYDNFVFASSIFGIYIVWIFIHYLSAHLYVYLCVPATIIGFILSPFLVPSPHCQALRWAIYNGGNSIIAMWVLLGAWLMKYFTVINA
jgi:hypothetical protein